MLVSPHNESIVSETYQTKSKFMNLRNEDDEAINSAPIR
jgi:hypothetical protein